jgi:hypothetical protein
VTGEGAFDLVLVSGFVSHLDDDCGALLRRVVGAGRASDVVDEVGVTHACRTGRKSSQFLCDAFRLAASVGVA